MAAPPFHGRAKAVPDGFPHGAHVGGEVQPGGTSAAHRIDVRAAVRVQGKSGPRKAPAICSAGDPASAHAGRRLQCGLDIAARQTEHGRTTFQWTERLLALAHMVTQRVDVPAERAFDFLADPAALGRWSLGCLDTAPAGPDGLHAGRSMFDGGIGWFRIDPDAHRLTIDYLVGTPGALSRRISARVVPGPALGHSAGSCLATLTAWRPAGMDKARWRRLRACHEAEILLIKAQLEGAP